MQLRVLVKRLSATKLHNMPPPSPLTMALNQCLSVNYSCLSACLYQHIGRYLAIRPFGHLAACPRPNWPATLNSTSKGKDFVASATFLASATHGQDLAPLKLNNMQSKAVKQKKKTKEQPPLNKENSNWGCGADHAPQPQAQLQIQIRIRMQARSEIQPRHSWGFVWQQTTGANGGIECFIWQWKRFASLVPSYASPMAAKKEIVKQQ